MGKDKERPYRVEIKEILSRVETVNAASLGEAIDKVMEKYRDEEIVLSADDFEELKIKQEKKEKTRI